MFAISFDQFPSGSVAETIFVLSPLRYVALACFFAATLDGIILSLKNKASHSTVAATKSSFRIHELPFKDHFRSRFPIPNQEKMAPADYQRFVTAREKLIEQAWTDAQRTGNVHVADFLKDEILCEGTELILMIANTITDRALLCIKEGDDINKYAPFFGNNPLTIAIMKGWNHRNLTWSSPDELQRPIIEALLKRKELNPNAIDLRTGMTALHYACMRGDDPALIKKLLAKGANPKFKDYNGKTAGDLLDIPYETVKKFLSNLCVDKFKFGSWDYPANVSPTITVPLEHERDKNIKIIRPLLRSNI